MKVKPKTFIIFSPAFAAGEADTIWLPWLQTFVRALNKNFHELEVIFFAFQYPHTTKAYDWHNNRVIPFNGLHKKKFSRLLMWVNIVYSVLKIKKTHDLIGILSVWCTECAFVAKYISNFLALPHFCWIVGQDARKENNYVRRIHPNAKSLIALSDFLADEFYRSHSIRPYYIVPHGIDISLINATSFQKDIELIGVGSLSVLKQYDVFVNVVAALKKTFPDIKAVLCGDGEDRQRIKAMINEFSLDENITLTGTLQHPQVLSMMQRAKILLHPSSYEGFSMACLEALYAGANVISFTQPMHHEIHNWHVVKTAEEMQAKAIELLRADTEYEAVMVYSADESARAIMKLFEDGFSTDRR